MNFKNSLNSKASHLILAGTLSFALGACSSGGDGTAVVPDPTLPPVVGTGAPQIIGSVNLPDDGSGVVVSGNYAYVAADSSGLQVIDVSNRSTPTIVAEQNTITAKGGVRYVDTGITQRIYMSGYLQGLHVIDVATPTAPALPLTRNTAGLAVDVAIDPDGGTSCVADGSNGVEVFSDALSQKNVITLENVAGVAKSGDYCFATAGTTIAGGAARLYVIDVSVPLSANILTQLPFIGSPSGIVIAGDYAYIAAGDPGMYIIDISNPAVPVIAGQTGALPATGPIAVDATRMRAYLGTTDTAGFPEEGLKIVDISNAGSPAVIATADLPDSTGGVFALDGYVYATTSAVFGGSATSQFHIVDVSAF